VPKGLAAAATFSRKKTNQDACAIMDDPKSPLSAVIVADGVGSYFESQVASASVASSIKSYLEPCTMPYLLDLKLAFAFAQKLLRQEVEGRVHSLPANVNLQSAYGTTALCAVDVGDSFKIGYVGNGAVWHLRGDFDQLSVGRLLPSSTVNLLNPHCRWYDGRSMLTRIISPTTNDADSMPTVLHFSKDDLLGDLLVLVSDGVYSYDDVQIGRDSKGKIFIEAKRSVEWLYGALSNFMSGPLTKVALQSCLESYLQKLNEDGLVDDDVTVAVLVSSGAMAYRRHLTTASSAVGEEMAE